MPPGHRAAALNDHRSKAASRRWIACSIDVAADGKLPTEFRLFQAGENDTSKGVFLFDEQAAASVMASYADHGVDLMIDLEHQSLTDSKSPDPTARDARGWCQLELRDGDLWAVNVRWTPDGEARLTERRQRYVSPAFEIDPDTRRVTSILNVAIVAMPATHDTPALVAASKKGLVMAGSMDPALVTKALDAVEKGDSKSALDILKGLLASAAGGDPDANTEDAPPPAGDGGADETTEAAGDMPQPAEPGANGNDATEKKKTPVAASRTVMLSESAACQIALSITGKTDLGEAMAEIERRSKVALDLEARETKLASARATLESAARLENAKKLVQLGAETPFTSGLASFAGGKKGKLSKRLLDEPIEDQNSRVAALLAARGGKLPTAPLHPPVGGGNAELTAKETAMLTAKAGGDAQKLTRLTAAYVKTKADIAARSNAPSAQEG